ncbi:uncharacterized protein LACBIDRAFT_336215 [Laccaria bicolor S238N-H82]|uniref:Predicted protein n=1 Tax=Laccaria bicolor (strain S238N-H82 / ATCC MYA-4686) TaxID=486041 RepID=B0E4R9_LACBS|nr:uncharacterized protein LACBIDRAFT_336215 [Laccaria bicolor S238N-H82]EDQ98163.1 predicted protein [Laccaria bicolor S238N-H82]|eukprot:XP_001891187.1 predicted protein [Laccaria bicolor S238N-H82]
MTAAEILDVSNEKKYWRSISQVREYVVLAKQDKEGMIWRLCPDEEPHPALDGNRQGSQHREWFNVALLKRTMHFILGDSLDKVIDRMTPEEIDTVDSQLQSIQAKLAVKPTVVGGRLPQAFSSVSDFVEYHQQLLGHDIPLCLVEDILAALPRDVSMSFAHSGFFPNNVFWLAIIDWATAGFYSEFWEYARMHDPIYSSPRA